MEDTDVKRMMMYLQILEKPQNDTDDDLTEREDAFEGLSMIVDNIDNANGMLQLFFFLSLSQFIVNF